MDSQMQLLFINLKQEMDKQTIDITESITRTVLTKLDEKLKPIVEENNRLKEEVQILNDKIKYIEIEKRGNNLVMFGIEDNNSKEEDLTTNIVNILQKTGINISKQDINKAYRIGGKEKEARPTLINFVCKWKRNEVLKYKKKLPKDVYVKEDFTKEVLEKRKQLLPQLEEERNKGRIAYLKYDKLIVKDKIDNNREKRKREPTTSPIQLESINLREEAAPQKINKINAFDRMLKNRTHASTEFNKE